ncbi:hypothetical protein [Synechococcus sp. PCC 7335]|nr:hypothetical protein [Synechococcus sp. PCC 7335]
MTVCTSGSSIILAAQHQMSVLYRKSVVDSHNVDDRNSSRTT